MTPETFVIADPRCALASVIFRLQGLKRKLPRARRGRCAAGQAHMTNKDAAKLQRALAEIDDLIDVVEIIAARL